MKPVAYWKELEAVLWLYWTAATPEVNEHYVDADDWDTLVKTTAQSPAEMWERLQDCLAQRADIEAKLGMIEYTL